MRHVRTDSAHLRRSVSALDRTPLCYPDSHLAPTSFGIWDGPCSGGIIDALAEELGLSRLKVVDLTLDHGGDLDVIHAEPAEHRGHRLCPAAGNEGD